MPSVLRERGVTTTDPTNLGKKALYADPIPPKSGLLNRKAAMAGKPEGLVKERENPVELLGATEFEVEMDRRGCAAKTVSAEIDQLPREEKLFEAVGARGDSRRDLTADL